MTRFHSFDRNGKVPRSALLLLLVLLVSLALLFKVSRNPSSQNLVLGGPLLDFKNTTINGFLLSQGGGQYRFDKTDSGYWTLRGGRVDFLSQKAVVSFLKDIEQAQGGQLFAGTEVEDRRYDFNSPEAVRLTVFTDDGRVQKLAVGAVNPVTGKYYASGVDRPGCFPVTEIFRNRLAAVPSSLQLMVLLPHFDRTAIQKIDIWFGDEHHLMQKFDSRWWLLQPPGAVAALGAEARQYHSVYSDRVKEFEGRTWLLAREDVASQLIYQCSEIIINEIPDPKEVQLQLQELALDPPHRRVRLHGLGINPDSAESSADMLEIAFGEAQDENRVPVLRRGNVLMTEREALERLDGSLADFLHLGAITFQVAESDSLRGYRDGVMVIKAIHGAEPTVKPGSQKRPAVESWSTVYPPPALRPDLRAIGHRGLSRNLIVTLDRLEILKVLPPSENREVLADKERVLIEVFGPGDEVRRLEFGLLNNDLLKEELVQVDDGSPPVGLWRPDTGQLLQVTSNIFVTMRSHFMGINSQ